MRSPFSCVAQAADARVLRASQQLRQALAAVAAEAETYHDEILEGVGVATRFDGVCGKLRSVKL